MTRLFPKLIDIIERRKGATSMTYKNMKWLSVMVLILSFTLVPASFAASQSQSERSIWLEDYASYLTSPLMMMPSYNALNVQPSAPESIWLVANGDIMFHSPQMTAAYNAQTGQYDFSNSFSAIGPYIKSVDYALANFETTTSSAKYQYSGYPAFNAPDEVLDAIKGAGYDFLSTANNHCLDRRLFGVERTIAQMDLRAIDHSGTFYPESPDKRYFVKDIQGFKVGILSATYGCNGYENTLSPEDYHATVNTTDETFLETQLTLMAQDNLDYKIVFIHWGNEYQRSPSSVQEDLADKLIEWGADAILGSHPHVIQPSETRTVNGQTKYIIYSMGNFISNQSRHTLSTKNAIYTEDGVMVFLKLVRHSDGSVSLDKVTHVPTWVHKYYKDKALTYEIEPIDGYRFNKLADTGLDAELKASYNRTFTQVTDYSADHHQDQ